MPRTKYKTRAEAVDALRHRQAGYMRKRYEQAAATVPVVTLDAEHAGYLKTIIDRTGATGPTAAVREALRIAAAAPGGTANGGAGTGAPAAAPTLQVAHTLPRALYDLLMNPDNDTAGGTTADAAAQQCAETVDRIAHRAGLGILRHSEHVDDDAEDGAAVERMCAALVAVLGGKAYVDALYEWEPEYGKWARGRKRKPCPTPPPIPAV